MTQRAGGGGTYDFDAVAGSGGECPGARLLAGVFIRPVGAGDDAVHAIHSVITASCKEISLNQKRPAKTALKLFLTQGNCVLINPNGCSDCKSLICKCANIK